MRRNSWCAAVEREDVRAGAHRERERGLRAVDDVARGELLLAGLKEGRGMLRRRAVARRGQDREDRADRDVRVDVRRAVERVDGDEQACRWGFSGTAESISSETSAATGAVTQRQNRMALAMTSSTPSARRRRRVLARRSAEARLSGLLPSASDDDRRRCGRTRPRSARSVQPTSARRASSSAPRERDDVRV